MAGIKKHQLLEMAGIKKHQLLEMVGIDKHQLLEMPGIEKALGNCLLVSFTLIAYSVVRYFGLHHLSFLPKTNNN
ncbi:unnamed protein product [Prunus armeniaca]